MEYSKIGFKCGIEIHQQLDGKKLFCDCPTLNLKDSSDVKICRTLKAIAGETGVVDKAAKFESKKEKYFIYEASSKDTCLVELDDEPPHFVNEEALKTTLEVSLLLNAKVVDEIQFMRKTVVDGSNVSGFQRTALIAEDGYVETSKGRVKIPLICLEEEAAQKLEESDEFVKYRLDRLGIPLIEIGTDPDIVDPDHAKETAEKLGMILRSTGKVKRGIGTIRQDVNISITGHPRVEIKGFQDIRTIKKTIENEVARQKKEKSGIAHVRKVNSDFSTTYLRPMPGAARMYPETDIKTISITKKMLKIELPELLENKVKKLEKYNIDKDHAKKIADRIEYFEPLFKKLKNLKPSFIIDTFSSMKTELKTHKIDNVEDSQIEVILTHINNGDIQKNNLTDALKDLIGGKLNLNKFKGVDDSEIENFIKKIVKDKPGLNPGAYMGLIMAKFKGKVDGKKAMEIVKKHQ